MYLPAQITHGLAELLQQAIRVVVRKEVEMGRAERREIA
jgi:hypothetical protein